MQPQKIPCIPIPNMEEKSQAQGIRTMRPSTVQQTKDSMLKPTPFAMDLISVQETMVPIYAKAIYRKYSTPTVITSGSLLKIETI